VPDCGACAASWASSAVSSSPQTKGSIFRRLFMVLKPNFLVKLSARVNAATHPSHRFAASYKAAIPAELFWSGILSQRKVYMQSMHKLLMQCVTATVAVSLAIPAMTQEPVVQGGTIKSQVSLVNLFATVRDKNKRIVPNLKQEDFRISER